MRLRSTVLAIGENLTENGFVLRYRTDETDDGLSGKEGTFLICSFWLVSALAVIGERQRARDLMERLLRVGSPLGLFAEEFDVETGRHLGNFPQAFSHLALIEAAGRIIASEFAEEMSGWTRRAAVIGGSVAGLASAIGLARRGWEVTVVERDLAPDTNDGDEAFLVWDRRNVPQFRQPHAFSARSRNLLLEHIPEVVDWLRADGIAEVNLFKMLAPPELWSDEDDAYTGLWSRRPAFELGIRRIAEAEPGVTIVGARDRAAVC